MSIKAMFRDEYQKFTEEEIVSLDAQGLSCVNMGEGRFYRHGAPAVHLFKREQLDAQIPKERYAIDAGLGKVVADQIATSQRAYNVRYGMCRLDAFVKQRVRCDQAAYSLEATRNRVSKELTS